MIAMRLALVLSAILLSTAACSDGDTAVWTPSEAAVLHVEAIVQLPDELPVLHLGRSVRIPPDNLQSYSRSYAGITVKGRRTIHGIYLHNISRSAGGIHIVGEKEIPHVNDGGCNVIELFYDVSADKITSILCNVAL